MKILLKLLSLLALLCPSASAYDAAQAEKIYGSGDFAQAAEAFAEQVRAQPDNPFAYYNLGNAQYKAGDTGAATASYYRAYLLLPRNADIRHNLQLALQKSGQNIVPPGVPESLHRLYTLFSVNELKALGWAMCWLLALLLLVKTVSSKTSVARPAYAAAALALFFWCWTAVRVSTALPDPAVVIVKSGELRSGPGENFGVSANMPEGYLVSILNRRTDWAEIALPQNGVKGWIKTGEIEALK